MLAYVVVRVIAPGPFFQFADGRLFARVRLVEAIQSALSSVGINATSYFGHGFRIGAATIGLGQLCQHKYEHYRS